MSITCQPREDLPYSRLKALSHYHAPAGREALLAARHRERRVAVSGGRSSGSSGGGLAPGVAPCTHHMTSTTRCGQGVVPMARYCPRHIMEQPGQVLYRACGAVTDPSDGPCETPVPGLFPHSTCLYHTPLQPLQSEARPRPVVPDMSSLVTEVFTAANNQEHVNNDASVAAEGEVAKEELPKINDEIENGNKETEVEAETAMNNAEELKVEEALVDKQ